MTMKKLTYGSVSLAALCLVLMLTPMGASAQQGIRNVIVDGFDTLLTSAAAIEAATEGAQTSLDNIEGSLSADAVHGNDVIATGPQGECEAYDVDGSAAPNDVAEGKSARAKCTRSGVGAVMLVSEDGSAVGAVAQSGTWNVGLSAGTNYAGKTRATDGTNDGLVDPCQSVAKTTTAFSQTSIANVIAADAAKINYICAIVIVASAAEVVSVVEDDTSGCGSLTAALAGSTTAANGMSLAANGGFTLGNGESTVLKGSANNRYLCIGQDGSDRISGSVTWVQR
jgi:hypothetical protein